MKDFFEALAFVIAGLAIIGLMLMSYLYISYKLDKTNIKVTVNNEQVYKGKSHFVIINPIGLNGNTKEVIIVEDIYGFRPIKKYVSNNVEIESEE